SSTMRTLYFIVLLAVGTPCPPTRFARHLPSQKNHIRHYASMSWKEINDTERGWDSAIQTGSLRLAQKVPRKGVPKWRWRGERQSRGNREQAAVKLLNPALRTS